MVYGEPVAQILTAWCKKQLKSREKKATTSLFPFIAGYYGVATVHLVDAAVANKPTCLCR